MTPEHFVTQVLSEIIDQNTISYKHIFETTAPQKATDPYWKRALVLFHSLNETDQTVFFEILRQVNIDTVSNLFAILDGVTSLEGQCEDFVLTTTASNKNINGNLQDLFLEIVEHED